MAVTLTAVSCLVIGTLVPAVSEMYESILPNQKLPWSTRLVLCHRGVPFALVLPVLLALGVVALVKGKRGLYFCAVVGLLLSLFLLFVVWGFCEPLLHIDWRFGPVSHP